VALQAAWGTESDQLTHDEPEIEPTGMKSHMTDQEMVNTLVALAQYYAGGGRSSDNRTLVDQARDIGRTLDRRGGIKEMRRIFNMIPPMQGKRTVEMEWDGIGGWSG